MRTFTLLLGLIIFTFIGAKAQSEKGSPFLTSYNSDDGKSWLRLSGSMGYSPILIGFIPGATDAYESMYDATFLGEGSWCEFYSMMDEGKYEIQGRSELNPQNNPHQAIPLGFQVTSAGSYTIHIVLEYIDPIFAIILEDKTLETFTDLRLSGYTFNVSNPVEDHNRFVLHYNYGQSLGINDIKEYKDSIKCFITSREIVSKVSKVNPLTISVYDVLGKEILNSDFKERIPIHNIDSRIFIVKYVFENSKTVTKKVVKR